MSGAAVAHVLCSLGVGGQERVVLDLITAQSSLGLDVYAISLSVDADGPMLREYRARCAHVEQIAKRSGLDPRLPTRLTRFFRRHRVRLVHTHNPMPLIYAAPAARIAGARVVHTKHGEHRDSGLRMALRRAAGRFSDAFVAVSVPTARVALAQRECPPDRLTVIRNGTALSRFGRDARARRAIRAELGIPDDAWVAGTVGRFVPEKNQELLLRAAAPLLGERHHLVMVGGGRGLEAARAEVARMPAAPWIRLIGERSDIPALLAALDVFAMSSVTEGLPIVLIEAMASGLPVVATAVGGIPGVLAHGRSGLLVASGDQAGLRRSLAELAADRPRAREMGERGRAIALAGYTAERMTAEYLTLYQRVLGDRRPGHLGSVDRDSGESRWLGFG